MIICQCKNLCLTKETTVREIAQVIGRLSASAVAVLPAPVSNRETSNQQRLRDKDRCQSGNEKLAFLVGRKHQSRNQTLRIKQANLGLSVVQKDHC